MTLSSPMIQAPHPPFEMIVNRPFVFTICDDRSGVVVFLGAIANPLAG
jgi:serine protease inhibitor